MVHTQVGVQNVIEMVGANPTPLENLLNQVTSDKLDRINFLFWRSLGFPILKSYKFVLRGICLTTILQKRVRLKILVSVKSMKCGVQLIFYWASYTITQFSLIWQLK